MKAQNGIETKKDLYRRVVYKGESIQKVARNLGVAVSDVLVWLVEVGDEMKDSETGTAGETE